MASRRLLIAAALLIPGLDPSVVAQTPSESDPPSGGREYWLAFPMNYRDWVPTDSTQEMTPAAPLELTLTITSGVDATGLVEVEGIDFRRLFSLVAGETIVVPVDAGAQLRSSGIMERLGVHVTSDNPVSVYACDRRYQTTDTWVVWPVESLGTTYRAVGYQWLQSDLLSQIAIVASTDETEILVAPTVALEVMAAPDRPDGSQQHRVPSIARAPSREERPDSTPQGATPPPRTVTTKLKLRPPDVDDATVCVPDAPADIEPGQFGGSIGISIAGIDRSSENALCHGSPVRYHLNRGEAIQLRPRFCPTMSSDLTGSLIQSNKPIAVFSGHNCAYVPDPGTTACNILVEQLPPVDTWGRSYVVGVVAERSSSVVRVIAAEDDTPVYVNGHRAAHLHAGRYWDDRWVRQPLWINADKPVMVVQYTKGFSSGDSIGDPSMMVIPPVESFQRQSVVTAPVHGAWRHYLQVIAPLDGIRSVRIDGRVVEPSLFRRVEPGEYAVAAIPITDARHVIESSLPVGLYQYGHGFDSSSYDAYGNAATYLAPRITRSLGPLRGNDASSTHEGVLDGNDTLPSGQSRTTGTSAEGPVTTGPKKPSTPGQGNSDEPHRIER